MTTDSSPYVFTPTSDGFITPSFFARAFDVWESSSQPPVLLSIAASTRAKEVTCSGPPMFAFFARLSSACLSRACEHWHGIKFASVTNMPCDSLARNCTQ